MVRSTFENPEKVRNAVHVQNYRGTGKRHTSNAENRTQYHNAEITENKENLLKGARPNGRKSTLGSISSGVVSIGDIKSTPNMLLKEQSKDRVENINFLNVIPSKESIGSQKAIYHRYDDLLNSRIDSGLVTTQLTQNPFYNLK